MSDSPVRMPLPPDGLLPAVPSESSTTTRTMRALPLDSSNSVIDDKRGDQTILVQEEDAVALVYIPRYTFSNGVKMIVNIIHSNALDPDEIGLCG